MVTFTGTDASRAIIEFWGAHSGEIPAHIRSTLATALGELDMLGRIVTTMEALYAARTDLSEEGIALLGGLARFVAQHNFYGKGLRAAVIAGVTERIGDGGETEVEGDPGVDPAFAAPSTDEAE